MSQEPLDRRRAILIALGGVALLAAGAVHGQGASMSPVADPAAPDFDTPPAALKHGQSVWAPNVAPAGPMLIYVDLSHQVAAVYRNGVRIGVTTVSSGKRKKPTPAGTFTILAKYAVHRSNKYNDAPMPFAERLTWDGVMLHGGGVPGFPESHGCVHLPQSFAKALFGETRMGVPVVMAGNPFDRPPTTEAGLLVSADFGAKGDDPLPLGTASYSWAPQRSPVGPLTIVVSKPDQMVVVLRYGIEIGRSAAHVEDDEPGSRAIALAPQRDGPARYISLGLPGDEDENGNPLEDEPLKGVQLPKAFIADLKAAVRPGTTILITDAGIGADKGETAPADLVDATL